MSCRVVAIAALCLVLPGGSAGANCGSESSCPLEPPAIRGDARFQFEVSQLYIDQDQPMVGADDAAIGAIPGHHDEVRTVSRVTNVRGAVRTPQGWAFRATLPYIHRTHEHIHHHMGEDHYERWNDRGVGDLDVSVTREFRRDQGGRYQATLGVNAPTGKQRGAENEDGDPIEASARIGTGSWGLTASTGAEWRLRAPGRDGDTTMPLRLSLSGRANGRGVEEYRHGAEAQAHVSTEYPVAGAVAALLQANYRVRAKDDVGDADQEEASNTGGAALYVTPGLRVDALSGLSLYGLVQLPVWERVNGIQVVATMNVIVGLRRSIL